jgi:hypothetical protein
MEKGKSVQHQQPQEGVKGGVLIKSLITLFSDVNEWNCNLFDDVNEKVYFGDVNKLGQ